LLLERDQISLGDIEIVADVVPVVTLGNGVDRDDHVKMPLGERVRAGFFSIWPNARMKTSESNFSSTKGWIRVCSSASRPPEKR
jgi:hypothetical protein